MTGSFFKFGLSVVVAGAALAFFSSPLSAQVLPGEPAPVGAPGMPPPAAEGAAIHSYLCMQREIAFLRARMVARRQALAALKGRLAALEQRLARERRRIDVNNPQQVARYKALLERRDALAEHGLKPAVAAARRATLRYNAVVGAYNARYANRPFDSVLVEQIRATLSCGPGR